MKFIRNLWVDPFAPETPMSILMWWTGAVGVLAGLIIVAFQRIV